MTLKTVVFADDFYKNGNVRDRSLGAVDYKRAVYQMNIKKIKYMDAQYSFFVVCTASLTVQVEPEKSLFRYSSTAVSCMSDKWHSSAVQYY